MKIFIHGISRVSVETCNGGEFGGGDFVAVTINERDGSQVDILITDIEEANKLAAAASYAVALAEGLKEGENGEEG